MSKRWKAVVSYRVQSNVTQMVTHEIEELEELQEIVESGPSFAAVDMILITYQREPTTLVEAAVA